MSLIEEVKRILWEDWDPIGVNGRGGPEDEYDFYAPGIAKLIHAGRNEHKIWAHLQHLQTVAMGLSQLDGERDQRVARQLVALRSKFPN